MDQPASPSSFVHDGRRYLPVRATSIDHCRLPMDLFLRNGPAGEPTLYRSAGIEFTPQDAARLAENEAEILYIPAQQHGVYRSMIGQRLARLITCPGPAATRAREVRVSCAGLIEDLLASPGQAEAAQAVAEVGAQLARWASADAEGFSQLLDMSVHDFYTATHMVNVAAGCGLLLRAIRPNDRALLPLIVQGGLLHDVGKRGVPETILTKTGRLDPEEWQAIRRHPRIGFEELRAVSGLDPVVLEMARDHHERLDGHGYPNEVSGEKISFAARLCAVVDVYDALTSSRPYRKPLSPVAALGVMAEGVGTHFDPGILTAWCGVVQGLIARDPSRAPVAGEAPQKLTLDSFIQHFERAAPPASGADRRRHPRFKYNTLLKASFQSLGRPCPVRVGEEFPVIALDLGQSGLRIRMPWPPALGDTMTVELPRKGGGAIRQHARVVRVTVNPDGSAHVGLQYEAGAKPATRAA
ncbi:MAG: HD domain-containing protein [Phycisphaerales bacterium]|nr:HD domain-containing protein [Phycisphaerales bacterium]